MQHAISHEEPLHFDGAGRFDLPCPWPGCGAPPLWRDFERFTFAPIAITESEKPQETPLNIVVFERLRVGTLYGWKPARQLTATSSVR